LIGINDINDIRAMFTKEIEPQDNEGHSIAGIVYIYVLSKKYTPYHRDDSDVLNDGNSKLQFDLLKSVYWKAKLYYPVICNNITEYISLSWLQDDDKIEIYDEEKLSDDEDIGEYRRV
jgi:hypothetical protein